MLATTAIARSSIISNADDAVHYVQRAAAYLPRMLRVEGERPLL
jgi:hypothetical protein